MNQNPLENNPSSMEKILRERWVWIIIPFLLIWTSSFFLLGNHDSDFNYFFLPLIIIFFISVAFMRGLPGISSAHGTLEIILAYASIFLFFIFYGLFIYFLINIKRINKRNLYIISAIIVFISLFVIRGLTHMNFGF